MLVAGARLPQQCLLWAFPWIWSIVHETKFDYVGSSLYLQLINGLSVVTACLNLLLMTLIGQLLHLSLN